jgi:hypothetical protein
MPDYSTSNSATHDMQTLDALDRTDGAARARG